MVFRLVFNLFRFQLHLFLTTHFPSHNADLVLTARDFGDRSSGRP
jgi:hypothetical protein